MTANHNEQVAAFKDGLDNKFESALERLRILAGKCDKDGLMAAITMLTTFNPIEQALESSGEPLGLTLELVAYALATAQGTTGTTPPTCEIMEEALEAANAALSAYAPGGFTQPPEDPVDRRLHQLVHEAIVEHRMVRGDAYPEQTEQMIVKLFSPFDEWFEQEVGILPNRLSLILMAILRRAEDAIHTLNTEAQVKYDIREELEEDSPANADGSSVGLGLQYMYDRIVETVFASREDLTEYVDEVPSEQEWAALSELIALTPDRQRNLNSVSDVRQFPLLTTQKGRLFPTDFSHCCDQLLETLEQRIEGSRLRDKYIEHRGEFLEDDTVKALKQVFGEQEVYHSAQYPNPDQNYERDAELDCLVYSPPFAIFVECKSNRVRMPAHEGDHNGLKDAVQKAEMELNQSFFMR